jgi:amino acid transporter
MSSSSGQEKTVFVRQATGLVRQISALEALGMVVTQMGLLYVFNVIAFTPAFYPTANPVAVPFIGLLLVLPIAGIYILLSIAIPRTGGDYVWVSRIFNPGLGFVTNFSFTLLSISVVGAVAPWIGEWSIGELYYDLGILDKNTSYLNTASYLQQPTPAFWIAAAFIVIAGAIVIARTKLAANVVKWWTFLSIAIGVIFIAVVLSAGSSHFASNFNSISGSNLTYDQVITAGQNLTTPAYNGVPPVLSTSTLYAGAVVGLLGYLGFNSSAYFAGEVRQNRKSQIVAQLGGALLYAGFTTAIIAAEYFGEGPKFVNSMAGLWSQGSGSYPFLAGAPPLASGMSIFWTHNTALVATFNLAFGLTAEVMNISIFFTLSRNLFAWSFDRVAPSAFADINPRTRTPIYAIIVMVIVGLIYTYISIFNFGLLSSLFDYGTAGTFIVFLVVAFAAIAYPYRRKDIFNASDPSAQRKIGGVPLITILGVLGVIVSLVTIYAILLPNIGTTSFGTVLLEGIIPTFVIGGVIYAIASVVRKRQGINLSLLQREIPPE